MATTSSNCDGNSFPFPEDVCCEILLSLPVKSLLRFKSVCKSWLSMIESSDFKNRHCRKLEDRILVMYCCAAADGDDFNMLGSPEFSLICHQGNNLCVDLDVSKHVLDCLPCFSDSRMLYFDGIICLYFLDADARPSTRPVMYIHLWNPATKQTRLLPQPDIPLPVGQNCWPTVHIGFGFDLKSNHYKVVRITLFTFMRPVESLVEVYNLTTDAWRAIDDVLPVDFIFSNIKQPLRDGRIFCWSGRKTLANFDKSKDHFILWFDFCNEEFGTVPFPASIRDNTPNITLAVTRDDNITSINHLENGGLEVWMMNEFGVKESWTKLYQIQPFWGQTVSILNDGVSFLVVWNGRLCIHNTVTQDTKKLPLQKQLNDVLDNIWYKESLVSVEIRNGAAPYGQTSPGDKHKRHKPLHWSSP